jgi:signal transduction histidine kinase
MRGYASLLRDGKSGPISQEQQEVLEIIARNIERLSLAVSELVNTERGSHVFRRPGRECQGDPKQP